MADTYVIAAEGIDKTVTNLESLPNDIRTSVIRAINKTADRTRARSARSIRDQVNFPASYLSGSRGRLVTKKKASGKDFEAIISGRERPTSLAQFAITGRPGSKGGVTVAVKPGTARRMPRAFLMKLRAGTAGLDTKFNLGLAIRLRPGETLQNKRNMVKLASGLYLLYGPSVNQVFDSVAVEESPEAARFLEEEFLRLMELSDA